MTRSTALLAVLLAVPASLPVSAADTGDFDGDGRLTIADIAHRVQDLPPSDGSLDRFMEYAEFARQSTFGVPRLLPAGLAYLELLRRSVPDPLPHWVRVFGEDRPWDQVPVDERVSIALEPAAVPGGAVDGFELTIRLHTDVRLKAFSILIEDADGILRIPAPTEIASLGEWGEINQGNRFNLGDFRVIVPYSGFFITRGRLVVHCGLADPPRTEAEIIEPGDYLLSLPVRLRRGTPAGKHQIWLRETSEVLLADSSPVVPAFGSSVEVTIANEVTAGWDEGIPPLELEPMEKRVLGQVQFRLANRESVSPAAGEPVLVAAPGEDVRLRVQMRTEVPLNLFGFRLEWTSDHLRCVAFLDEAIESVFRDPEDGGIYPPHRQVGNTWGWNCEEWSFFLPPHHQAIFDISDKYPQRSIEHFRPLGEWMDLTEVQLHVSSCAEAGEEIPLTFLRYSAANPNSYEGPGFKPYAPHFNTLNPDWNYDLDYQDGFIRVSDAPWRCPEDLPDPGVRLILGSAAGSPGQEVEVPILASAEGPNDVVQLSLESDPPEAVVGSVWLEVKDRLTPETRRMSAARGGYVNSKACDTCDYGIPGGLGMAGNAPGSVVEDRFAVILINVPPDDGSHRHEPPPDYPGKALTEIGRLRLTIPADFAGTEIRLKHVTVPIQLGPLVREHRSGAVLRGGFYPAKETVEGVIRVVGPGRDFLRGDVNQDLSVDLSDAVFALYHLFLSSDPLACEDAADADDSGEIDISDPIVILRELFLGTGRIAEPHSACGPDPAPDGLDCLTSFCAGG